MLINLKDGNGFITDRFEVRDNKFYLEGGVEIDMIDVVSIETYIDVEPEVDSRQITIDDLMKGEC